MHRLSRIDFPHASRPCSAAETDRLLRRSVSAVSVTSLGNLAKLRIQQKRFDEAVDLFRQRYTAATHAENLYDLADALRLASHKEEAAKAFAEFEQKSLLESGKTDNSNHELIMY